MNGSSINSLPHCSSINLDCDLVEWHKYVQTLGYFSECTAYDVTTYVLVSHLTFERYIMLSKKKSLLVEMVGSVFSFRMFILCETLIFPFHPPFGPHFFSLAY